MSCERLNKMKWFHVNSIAKGVYAISEPYHWEKARCYLFVGINKAILVDTGTGLCPLKPIIDTLTNLPITVILTHCHWDHIGSINSFTKVYIHLEEENWLKKEFLSQLKALEILSLVVGTIVINAQILF